MALFKRTRYSVRLNGVKCSMRKQPDGWEITMNGKPIGTVGVEITGGLNKQFYNVTIEAKMFMGGDGIEMLDLLEKAAVSQGCSHLRIFLEPISSLGKMSFLWLEAAFKAKGYHFCSFFTKKYFEKGL